MKYSEIVNEINKGIKEFNKYLSPKIVFNLLDDNYLSNKLTSWRLQEESWDQRSFPSGDSKGIYFIFGENSENHEKLGVYVGKASHSNSFIGGRLHSHLNSPDRNEKVYKMKHKEGFIYYLEFVTTIPMDEFPFLASALEEFLIYYLKSANIDLLNHIGNK